MHLKIKESVGRPEAYKITTYSLQLNPIIILQGHTRAPLTSQEACLQSQVGLLNQPAGGQV